MADYKFVYGGDWAKDLIKDLEDTSVEDLEKNFEYEEFHPRVYIYRGLLPRSEEIVEFLKMSQEDPAATYHFNGWHPWFGGGEECDGTSMFNPLYPELVEEEKLQYELSIKGEIDKAFAMSVSHFLKKHGMPFEDSWHTMGPSICMYAPDSGDIFGDDEMNSLFNMKFHTDYDFMKEEEPGDKFLLTCTMYLNDDYEGGELIFDFTDDLTDSFGEGYKDFENAHVLKPKAGDIVVFPSGHPDYLSEGKFYYHAVGKVKNTPKYFIRNFVLKPYEGSDAWNANLEKYGDSWYEMERERLKARVKTHEELVQLKINKEPKECGMP